MKRLQSIFRVPGHSRKTLDLSRKYGGEFVSSTPNETSLKKLLSSILDLKCN